MSTGGRWQAAVAPAERVAWPARLRVLSLVLVLELAWLLLVAAAVIFLAAHLGGGPQELTEDEMSRRMLLSIVPAATVALGLALIGARQAVERRATAHEARLPRRLAASLWITAAANAVVVILVAISLYHARMPWTVVGIALGAALAAITAACVRAART